MRMWLNWRFVVTGGLAAAAAVAVAVAPASAGASHTPVNGAEFTTTNPAADNGGDGDPTLCLNGNPGSSGPNYVPAIDCNIYTSKSYVWLSGGPGPSHLSDGTYYFSVLVPGGQPDPNDGGAKVLSDTSCAPYTCPASNADGSSIPSGDAYANRTFSISGGVITYSGSHDFANNLIRAFPYDDTTNPGGVYILATCSLADGYPADPSDCKYDAFKVQQANVAPPALDLLVTKDATGSDTRTYRWNIQKAVDKTRVTSTDGSSTFSYTVSVTHDDGTVSDVKVTGSIQVFNPNTDSDGNVLPVGITSVSDQLSDGTVCAVTGGGPQTLSQFETDFAYSCNLSGLPQGELDNTATVTWPDQHLADGVALAGSSATFTFSAISFAETPSDECVAVTDSMGGALGTVCVAGANPTEFTYDHTFTGDPAGTCTNHDNTATFTTNDTGATGSAGQTVSVCVGADLKVEKTAVPSYTRTYNWQIDKAVDKTFLDAGGTATYTVTVTETGFTDSAFTVSGTITVSNPNDWEAITADISDAIDNGGACSLTGATGVTIPASGSVTLAYSCTFASNPGSGANTATATWDAAAASTPDGSSSGTASYQFGEPTNRVNRTIHVTDTYSGLLGTATATDSAPLTVTTFSYSRHFTPPATGCQTIDNTATIIETGQSAGASVRVCNTGALTMGFWQNKNGQAIIKAGASTAGVCNSGTWLRQLAPFQDLGATATCAQVAAYFTSIFNAANASGASMNAMLKAQMLATSFDVYFSDPALGGNKIGAPAPIGGVTIDLTRIWGSEDVSAAFGGATSMTVMQMLQYASSQSNVGGTIWYGQVKATQGLAKDAFDSINNQTAVSP
jgi:hypothetical protein